MMRRGSWFPIIYPDLSNGCAGLEKPRCVQYSPNVVFNLRENMVIVTNPHNCIYLYTSCELVCPRKAIAFSRRTSTPTKRINMKKMLIRKTKCDVCDKIYWTNIETDMCLDYERKEHRV